MIQKSLLFGVLLLLFSSVWTSACVDPSKMGPFGASGPEVSVEETSVEVRGLREGFGTAQELLSENFSAFLERAPLGFDQELAYDVWDDGAALIAEVETTARSLNELTPLSVLEWLLPLMLLSVLLALFWFLDRQCMAVAHRIQGQLHLGLSSALTRLLRALVIIAGRSAAVGIVIIPSYFPIQALFDRSPWTRFLTALLWLTLVYRLCHGLITMTFSGRLLKVAEEHARRLEFFGVTTARIAYGFLALLFGLSVFEYRPEAQAFVLFCFKVTMAVVPIYFLFARQSILSLLPEHPRSRFFVSFKRGLEKNFHLFLGSTVALLFLNAAGFTQAASFILVRGYSIIALVALTFGAAAKFREYVRAQSEADPGDPVTGILRTVERLVTLVSGAVIFIVTLRLLAVYEPIVALLRVPFLAVGRVEVSLFNLVSVALIIGLTILSTKLFKALLNAKIYPALDVEIGVAYAINTLINYALFLVGFFLSLFALGVHLSAVLVVFASLGVGIGFGLQTLVENLISGFIILFGRSVKKGDFITVNNVYGQVEAVGARSVVVRTPDNYDMLVPSKEIVSGQIINWTYHDNVVRLHIPVGVSYKSHPREVERVLLEACKKYAPILESPAPEVWLTGFGDSAINFSVLVYFDCRAITERRLRGQFNFIIWDALEAANIQIPFPQRDLHLKSSDISSEEVKGWSRSRQSDDKKAEH